MNAYLQILLAVVLAIVGIVASWWLFVWYVALPMSVAIAFVAFGYVMDNDRLGGVRA